MVWKRPVPLNHLGKDVMLMDLDCIASAFVPLSPFKFSLLKSNYDGILSWVCVKKYMTGEIGVSLN